MNHCAICGKPNRGADDNGQQICSVVDRKDIDSEVRKLIPGRSDDFLGVLLCEHCKNLHARTPPSE